MAVADDDTDALTDAHSLEQALLGSILATVPDALIVIDMRGRIVSFSAAAQRMFQYAEADVLGENISVLMPSPDRERHDGYIGHYLATGERKIIGVGRLTSARRRDGSTFPIELSVGEVEDQGQRLFTGFIRDLTERQQAERRVADLQAELAHAGRVTAMGTLASALAHELNQPLTAILAQTRAACMDAAAPAQPTGLLSVGGLPWQAVADQVAADGLHPSIVREADQLLLGGPVTALQAWAPRLEAQGARCTPIGARIASHTPWLAAAVPPWRAHLQAQRWCPPQTALVANATARVEWQLPALQEAMAVQPAQLLRFDLCLGALAERGQPFQREAYLARLLCAEKAMKIGTDAVQLLGGHGFTKEHPAERWYRDLRAVALMAGGLHL